MANPDAKILIELIFLKRMWRFKRRVRHPIQNKVYILKLKITNISQTPTISARIKNISLSQDNETLNSLALIIPGEFIIPNTLNPSDHMEIEIDSHFSSHLKGSTTLRFNLQPEETTKVIMACHNFNGSTNECDITNSFFDIFEIMGSYETHQKRTNIILLLLSFFSIFQGLMAIFELKDRFFPTSKEAVPIDLLLDSAQSNT